MKRAVIAGGAFVIMLVVLTLAAGHRTLQQDVDRPAASSPVITPAIAAAEEAHQGFLYGRIATLGGATYEGRLRWSGNQEAFWGDYFNGFDVSAARRGARLAALGEQSVRQAISCHVVKLSGRSLLER